MSGGGFVVEPQSRTKIIFRILKLKKSGVGISAIYQRVGVIRFQSDSRRVIFNGRRKLFKLVSDDAAVVVSLCQLRVEFDCRVVSR